MVRRASSESVGQGLVEYAILLALLALVASGALLVMGGGVGGVYRRATEAIGIAAPATPTPVASEERDIAVSVLDARDRGIADVAVFAYDGATGIFLKALAPTQADGTTLLAKARPGVYTFRADYQAQQFWSEAITAPQVTKAVIKTGRRPLLVRVVSSAELPLASVSLFAFTFPAGNYTGVSGLTDAQGNAWLDLADGVYKVRADYLGKSYWSEQVSMPATSATTIKINLCDRMRLGDILLLGPGGGVDGGRVAVRVEGAGFKVTVTAVEVDWRYLDSLPNEPGGKMRVYGIYVCPGNSTSCSTRNRWLNNINYSTWSTDMDDDTSPSSASANPQELPADGGWIIVDFDSLSYWEERPLSGAPWYARPSDFGFVVQFKECPPLSKPAIPR